MASYRGHLMFSSVLGAAYGGAAVGLWDLDWGPVFLGAGLTTIGGLAVAASLLGPNPIERLLYPFSPELAHPIMRIFVEMQPLASLFSTVPFQIGLMYVVAALTLLTVILRFRRYRLWELALMAGLAVLANGAFRCAR